MFCLCCDIVMRVHVFFFRLNIVNTTTTLIIFVQHESHSIISIDWDFVPLMYNHRCVISICRSVWVLYWFICFVVGKSVDKTELIMCMQECSIRTAL